MPSPEPETTRFWRHARFWDLGLLNARFTRHRYDLHTHPTYVIALITEGCERIRIGTQRVLAPAGTVAVVNPEQCHDGEPGADGGWAYRTFYPSVGLLTMIARELGQAGPPLFASALIEDRALAHALAVAHAASTSVDAANAETSMLLALRHIILRYGDWGGCAEPIAQTGSRHRFALYQQIIDAELEVELDLQRFAAAAGVTRFQVIRDFKKVAGLTPAAFIRNWKLRRAGDLIERGASLADAAFSAGFADQSHLSRTFRAVLGITPGEFQKGVSR